MPMDEDAPCPNVPTAPAEGGGHMEQRLLAAFEHLKESIVLTDPEDRFVLANRAFRELNRNVAHAIRPGRKFADYMRAGLAAGNYPDAVGREREWLEARLAERLNPGSSVERQRHGGRWFLIEDRRLPDGSTIRFGTEITDRKRAEAVLSERNRDLQLIMDSVPVMITRLDREERFVFANRAYTALMERSGEEIIGRRIADVLSAEVYAQIKPALNRALAGDPVSVERVQRRSNGERIRIEGRYIPDVDVWGHVIGLIAIHRDVTAERGREEMLAALLRNMPGDVYRCRNDRDWSMEFVSDGVFDLTGYPPSAFTTERRLTYGSLVHLGDRDRIWQETQSALAERRPYMLEYRIRDARGADKWVWERGFGEYAEDGTVLAMNGFVADMTLRKSAEQLRALEHAVSRSLAEADNAQAGLRAAIQAVCESESWDCGRYFRVDEEAGVLRFADAWSVPDPGIERFIERSRELVYLPGAGLSGRAWQSGQALWSADVSKDPRSSSGSSGVVPSRDIGVHGTFVVPVVSDGKTIGVLSFASRKAREPEQRLLEAVRAICGQVGQFLQRKLAEQSLRASEERFRAIFERSSAGIAITDTSGAYLSVNAAFARFFGYSVKEIVGRMKVSDLRSVEDAEGVSLYHQLVSGEIAFFERDRPYRRKDGAQIWGRATVSAVHGSDGNAPYVVAVFTDITDEMSARKRIERMNAELEERVETRTAELREAMKELDAFTYSVSHDLRAPIGAVSGFAHLLRSAEAARLSEDGLRLLGFIEHNAERMTRLIEGLLRFSRLGRSELRRARVSMNELAGETLLDFVNEAARARISAAPMPDCEGDPALLSQVWSNLLGNALKYSRDASLPCIDIGWDTRQHAYYVRDNGAGFDMAHAGKLFGVFERLHHESEFDGNGIGLAIAERIVRLHGGAIWADAAPGRGATFWFTVPASGNGAASGPRLSLNTPR